MKVLVPVTILLAIVSSIAVVSFKVLASARIVCNIVCESVRLNPQGIAL
jgi:hypothetical protein